MPQVWTESSSVRVCAPSTRSALPTCSSAENTEKQARTKRCIRVCRGGREEGALKAVLFNLAHEPSGEHAERLRSRQQAQLFPETKPGPSPQPSRRCLGSEVHRPGRVPPPSLLPLLWAPCPEARCAASEASLRWLSCRLYPGASPGAAVPHTGRRSAGVAPGEARCKHVQCSSQQAVGWFLVEERHREWKALVQSPGLTSWYGSMPCCGPGAARLCWGGPLAEPGLN